MPTELQMERARAYMQAWKVDWFTDEQVQAFALRFSNEQ